MTKKPNKPHPADHHDNLDHQAILNRIRTSLSKLSESSTKRDIFYILDGMSSTPSTQSWILLYYKLCDLDTSLASLIISKHPEICLPILESAKTGAHIIPVLHLICSSFMDAYHSCLNSWQQILHDVVERFEKTVNLDGMIQNHIVNMARFGSRLEDDNAFVFMIQEIYVMHGRYDKICDICNQILEFTHKDAQSVLPFAHIERSIASLADHAIEQNVSTNTEIIKRCMDILKRRAQIICPGASLPGGAALTFRAISKLAHFLMQYRISQIPSPWPSHHVIAHSLMSKELVKHIPPISPSSHSRIQTEKEGLRMLVLTTKKLGHTNHCNSRILRSTLEAMIRYVNKNMLFDAKLHRYITNMARFGSGILDELPCCILLDFCIERGMYAEVYGMCYEMGEFIGADEQRMAGSTLIECVLGALLRRIFRERISPDNDVVSRCATLLEIRSVRLGLGFVLRSYRGEEIRQAELLASDISVRKRMRCPAEICSWIHVCYPRSDKFLDLVKHMDNLVASKSALATHASSKINSLERASTYKKNYASHGALDDLETLLEVLENIIFVSNHDSHQSKKTIRRIDPYSKSNYSKWKKAMRSLEIWDALLEMNLYVRCKRAKLDVQLHPKIDKKRKADVKISDCYIEAYSPLDPFTLIEGHFDHDFRQHIYHKFVSNIMDKSQIKFFGKRQSMLVVECHWDTFNDPDFRKLLETDVQSSPTLGGVLLVLHQDGHYKTFFIKNRQAYTSVSKKAVKQISSALEPMIKAEPPLGQKDE